MAAQLITFDEEEDRLRRRDRACILSGAGVGAGVGALVGVVAPIGGTVLAIIGALALVGAAVGKVAARRISVTEWDPLQDQRPFVGAAAPDDDITS